MKIEKPRVSIKTQNYIDTPVVSDNTLVDDPVALVDDIIALVGGLAVTYSNMPLSMKFVVPRPIIKINR